jgi:hypothetical protein
MRSAARAKSSILDEIENPAQIALPPRDGATADTVSSRRRSGAARRGFGPVLEREHGAGRFRDGRHYRPRTGDE